MTIRLQDFLQNIKTPSHDHSKKEGKKWKLRRNGAPTTTFRKHDWYCPQVSANLSSKHFWYRGLLTDIVFHRQMMHITQPENRLALQAI